MVLPTEIKKATSQNPRFLVYFGKPKSGKTTIAAALPDSLLVDLENGSWHVDACSVQASSVEELGQIAKAIKEKEKYLGKPPYKYIVLDNATKLEEIAQPYALQLYRQTAMGREYNGNILDLPRGAGYIYLREAVTKVINLFKTLAPNFILIAHTKESMIDKDGKELNEMSIDLTGKLARIVAADADAVGYVYRTKENEVHINFMAGEDVIVGARARHLENKDIVIAKQDDKGKIISDWKQIYQNLK